MLPLGTTINAAAVIIGGAAGLLLRGRLPDASRRVVFQALGLCIVVIGLRMALTFSNPLPVIFSMVIGGVIGQACGIESRFESVAVRVKRAVKASDNLFTDGLVTASLIYCVGPMAILGAFDEGLRQDPTLILTKSMLDGFASIALAATYGVGVLFAAVPVFLYQFSLTLFAGVLAGVFSQPVIDQLTATGGLLIMGIGINLLELTRIPVANLLPALVIIVILARVLV